MSGISETATVTLNINGAQAKQMMSGLEQEISDTEKKFSIVPQIDVSRFCPG